jgi:preprotein translocase subunit SecD
MNRNPLWKYILIGAIVGLGFLYTLPNFFGQVPAVQVKALGGTAKPDTQFLGRMEEVLKKAGIAYRAASLEGPGVELRFADTDTQLRARDTLEKDVNPNAGAASYVVALNLVSDSPRWLAAIGAKPMYLGLDLRGGVHFLFQVDMKTALTKRMDSYVSDLRTAMRDEKIYYSGIAREGDRIRIRFRAPEALEKRQKALALIKKKYSDFVLTEEGSGEELTLSALMKPEAVKTAQDAALQQNIVTLRNRVNELGVAEPVIQQQGADRVVVQLPGVQDPGRAKDILGRTATLEIRMVEAHEGSPESRDYAPEKIQAARKGEIPFGTEFHISNRDSRGEGLLLSKQVVITGERLTNAAAGFDENGRASVNVDVDGQGGRIIRETTRQSVKRRMAILLIEKNIPTVLTAPTIQSELGSRFQITGMASTEEANNLALLLRAGSLAAPMEIVEERTVGPSLGKENIERGFHSTWIGFAAIAVFMTIYYLLFGFVSVVALAINVLLLVGLLSMLQATLTLPGMAGIALTVGMAIDANVLINERIREELRNGNSPQASIAAGYERAFGTIIDSNATTLIAGLALLAFGSGPVRGFAVVLCLGILTSIFSAVMVSRAIVNWIYGRRKKIDKLMIGNTNWREAAAA